MHWASSFFYMDSKFEPLEKRIKNDWHESRQKFSEVEPDIPFLTTKGMKKFWKSRKYNQMTRNDEDTNQTYYDM